MVAGFQDDLDPEDQAISSSPTNRVTRPIQDIDLSSDEEDSHVLRPVINRSQNLNSEQTQKSQKTSKSQNNKLNQSDAAAQSGSQSDSSRKGSADSEPKPANRVSGQVNWNSVKTSSEMTNSVDGKQSSSSELAAKTDSRKSSGDRVSLSDTDKEESEDDGPNIVIMQDIEDVSGDEDLTAPGPKPSSKQVDIVKAEDNTQVMNVFLSIIMLQLWFGCP